MRSPSSTRSRQAGSPATPFEVQRTTAAEWAALAPVPSLLEAALAADAAPSLC